MNRKHYKIGYTTGVFDMFHIGHLNILRRAKERCDFLIVGVTTDELCYMRKQKYPMIGESERLEIIQSIRYVDRAIFQTDMDKVAAAKKLGADAIFVGSDWKNTPSWISYEKELKKIDCDVVYLEHTDGISSSILRQKLSERSDEFSENKN